ncbi:MAG: hypothetical protein IJJ34_02205 [Clostridia bacterium]|nr:hypothetical protein [Clostridia bacterium]MBR3196164.1 hypothetical protein [Clostridia bacterium]
MKPWLIVLIIVGVLLICSAIVHRRVIKSLIKFKKLPLAPKWHVWLPVDKRRK